MYTDPNVVRALLDAKVQEVNQLADYFKAKDKAVIACLNRINEMLIDDSFEASQYNSQNFGYGNSKSELLSGKTLGGIILYTKTSEAKALSEILVELLIG